MNQENNNLNQNNLNTQGSNGVPNNQPLNNQSPNISEQLINNVEFQQVPNFQQPINPQPQPAPNFQQSIMQEITPQSTNNTFESGNASNKNFNSKPPKKNNKLFIIIAILAVIVVCVIFIPKLLGNRSGKNSDNNSVNGNNSHEISNNVNDNNKIKNIVYRNKELNVNNNYKDFIIQFKGLGCNLKIPNVLFNKAIDTLDENYIVNLSVDPENFGQMWDDNSIVVLCETIGVSGFDTEFKLYFDKNDSESVGMKYSDRIITKYEIYSPLETVIVNFDKGTLNLSTMVKDSTSFDNLLKQLGKYNSWEYISEYKSKLIYYTSDYNIGLFTFDGEEDEIINSDEIYFHGMEIVKK